MWIPFRAIKRSVDAALEFEAAMNRIQAVTRSEDIEAAARRVEVIRGDWPSKPAPKEAEEPE